MDYLRKLHMLFFSPQELAFLWRDSIFGEVLIEMSKKGYSLFPMDIDKLKEITDNVSIKRFKQKEEIEIYIALSTCVGFFGKNNTKIGFPLIDSISPKNIIINTLNDLKSVCKEKHLTDFAISSNKNVFEFQLKQYRKTINTNFLLLEIKKKLKEYGCFLGTTNIIFNLQGDGLPFAKYEIDFEKIYIELKKIINPKTTGHVYIKYNEQNKYYFMIDVYPKLGKHKVPSPLNLLKSMLKEKKTN